MAERGVIVDHSTLHLWVIRLMPLLDKAFRLHERTVGRRWRMDETYIKIKDQWKYLYRTVDTAGQTVDFLLAARRDAAAALRFFRKAIRHHGEPEVVTIDKSGANTADAGIQIVSTGTDDPGWHRTAQHDTKRAISTHAKRGIIPRGTILFAGCLNKRQRNFCQLHVTNATEPNKAIPNMFEKRMFIFIEIILYFYWDYSLFFPKK